MALTQYKPVVKGAINYNPPPLRSPRKATSIPEFFKLVEQAMGIYIQTRGTPDATTPVLVHEFPKERLAKVDDPLDIITFKVSESKIAPTMKDGSTPRGPLRRESIKHPTKAGY